MAAGFIASSARADGDPASDYLIGQQVFLSYDAKIPAAAERKLLAVVASANKRGFPLRVALIWTSYDLGSVPELFGDPRKYARFLDAEDYLFWCGKKGCGSENAKTTMRLLVVMPQGLGFAQWKQNPTAAYKTISGITVTRTPEGLATAATSAVIKLAKAAGVTVSTTGGPPLPTQTGNGGVSGTSSRNHSVEIIVAVVAALLLGVAALLYIRRRAGRSGER